MANVLFGGFHLVSGTSDRVRRCPVASSNSAAIFKGDAVIETSVGVVEAATAGGIVKGIVRDASYVLQGKRVDSKYIPVTTVYDPTTGGSVNASYVYVYDDPNSEFWVCVASAASTDTAVEVYDCVGSNMDLVASTAGSTVYGQSGMKLDGTEVAGSAQFRILEIQRVPGNDLASVNWRARVRINEHQNPANSLAGI